jgi:germination protein YpeB
MEEGFSGLPRLVYDGPFSTHLQNTTPKMTANLTHQSRDRAREAAALALECTAGALKEAGDENGALPAYLFTFGTQTAAVTKQGGFLLWMNDAAPAGSPVITLAQAKQTARQKLKELGFHDMESSYHELSGGVAVFHFAAFQNGVVCYPDLIKIGVALDSGRVVQLDARGYLMNHHGRSLPSPTLSAREAEALLSPQLEAQSSRLALIPSPGGEERLCHEFLCRSSFDRQVLVYLNAATGRQEDLLLLEIGPNGSLTV